MEALCLEPNSYLVKTAEGALLRRNRWAINIDRGVQRQPQEVLSQPSQSSNEPIPQTSVVMLQQTFGQPFNHRQSWVSATVQPHHPSAQSHQREHGVEEFAGLPKQRNGTPAAGQPNSQPSLLQTSISVEQEAPSGQCDGSQAAGQPNSQPRLHQDSDPNEQEAPSGQGIFYGFRSSLVHAEHHQLQHQQLVEGPPCPTAATERQLFVQSGPAFRAPTSIQVASGRSERIKQKKAEGIQLLTRSQLKETSCHSRETMSVSARLSFLLLSLLLSYFFSLTLFSCCHIFSILLSPVCILHSLNRWVM